MSWKDSFPKENRYFETENGILYNAEAIETMNKFPEQIFDAIITDPPYGTTACKWDSIIPFEDMWVSLKKIRKEKTTIILFGSEPFSSALRMSNIKEFKYDWIWEKERGSNFATVKYQPFKKHEIISIFSKKPHNYYPIMKKGKPYICKQGYKGEVYGGDNKKEIITINKGKRYPHSILKFKRDRGLHPTQKPLELLEYLIKTYTTEKDLILDFTSGSGTTLIAAEKLKRRWIGIELEEKYCEITKQRLNDLQ